MKEKIIQQGAEAILIKSSKLLIKRRIKKSYRLDELDEGIRKSRTKKEARLLEKAGKIIFVPKVEKVDEKRKEIVMEFISGKKLSESLDLIKNSEKICKLIGKSLAGLHDKEIIHGDLTTSNMIYSEKEEKLYIIDFGLGYISRKVEDRAVDLHLIKQALEAKHFKNHKKFFNYILKGYNKSPLFKETIERLRKVELRGRYKQQI